MEDEFLKQPMVADRAVKVIPGPYLQQTALEESDGMWTQDIWFLSKSQKWVELTVES